MFDSLRARLIVIAGLIVLSVWAIWPRPVITRSVLPDSSVVVDTTRPLNIKRGLDLQGGIHLALELDESGGPVANKADAIDRALKVIRTRVDEFGVTEPLVQKEGAERIVVELAGISDPERAKAIIKRSAFLEFLMTDENGLLRGALPAMDRALTSAGVSEGTIGRELSDSTARRQAPATSAVEDILGGARDTSRAAGTDTAQADTSNTLLAGGVLSSLLFQGNMPGEFMVAEEKVEVVTAMLQHQAVRRLVPRGIVVRWGRDPVSRGARTYRALYALQERSIMTGEHLVDAQARLDPLYNQAVVDFRLTRRGGRIFERETTRNLQKYMAVVLDNRVASQPAVIRGVIADRGQIELGTASLQEAQDLALVLKAGALPAPLQIVEERTVKPSLGEDSIAKGVLAGIVGVALVVILIVTYYRLSGVLAVAALSLYMLFTLGAMAMLDATLTLPGIAGFALSITMAVDANVLIFERIREELAAGKSVRLAIDAGFKMAMNAIVDSNVSMILTAMLLFQFGTGPVKGFAVMLIVGVLASMITAIFVTKTFFLMLLARRQQTQTLSI